MNDGDTLLDGFLSNGGGGFYGELHDGAVIGRTLQMNVPDLIHHCCLR